MQKLSASLLFVCAFLFFMVAFAFLNQGFVNVSTKSTGDGLVYFKYISVNPFWFNNIASWIGLFVLGISMICFGSTGYIIIQNFMLSKEVMADQVKAKDVKDTKKVLADAQFALSAFIVIGVCALVFNLFIVSCVAPSLSIIGYVVGGLIGAFMVYGYLKIKKRKQLCRI
jgi:hypothetical protein